MDNWISVVNYEAKQATVDLPPQKRFKWRWVHNKAMTILDWLYKYDDRLKRVEYTRTQVSEESITLLCLKSFELAWGETGRPPKLLIIGSDAWMELSGEVATSFSGSSLVDISYVEGNQVRTFNSIRIQVVPYITGAFCLPDNGE